LRTITLLIVPGNAMIQ